MSDTMEKVIYDSFVQYSAAVLQSRALVDVRDCIKPSARQIFYCMETDKFTADKPFKKTLKAIGSAMRLFIHGDSSCEGVIMRSSQPFAMRYPLVEVEGSNGNLISTESWAAPRYCLTGDTLVNTSKGLIRLDSITPTKDNTDNPLEETVYFKGFNKITSSNLIFNSGKHECTKITLKNGLELKGTGNHPLLVLDERLEFNWKTLDELHVGDKVLINLGHNVLYPENTQYNDVNFAAALGCLVSEGCLTSKNKINIINKNLQMIYPVEALLRKFNSKATIRHRDTDDCYQLTTTNSELYNRLNDLGCCFNSYEKRIPDYILRGTRECQVEFLKYLFEGDGCIHIRNNTYGTINYSSVSEQLIRELQILLISNFGIVGSIHRQSNRKEFKLEIGGEDLYVFAKEIGFVSERKKNLLEQAGQYYINNINGVSSGSRGWHIYPEIKHYLNKYHSDSHLITHRSDRSDECKGPLMSKAGLPILKSKLNYREYSIIENLYYNYAYIEIVGKENIGRHTVYSPKINESTNEYTSNGLISHNTASRLSPLSSIIFDGLKQNAIDDWRDNYDDTEKYPAVLPSIGYYNICNGTLGIGIAASSSIPAFNLKEVNQAIVNLINEPDVSYDKIYCVPDFATGGLLLNEREVYEILKKGQGGSCKLRAVMKYIPEQNMFRVTEMPYNVYTNTVCKELDEQLENNNFIEEYKDLTGKEPCIEIYLKKNVNVSSAEKWLYKNTSLENFYTINMTMLDQGRFPKVFGWREALQAYIDHIRICKRREIQFELDKALSRKNIVEGLLHAAANIDDIVYVIRNSESPIEAAQKLIAKYSFNEEQTKAILAIKLSSLTKIDGVKLESEKADLLMKINEYQSILNDSKKLDKILIDILNDVAAKFGDNRRTKIVNIMEEKEEDLSIPAHNVTLHLLNNNCFIAYDSEEIATGKKGSKGKKIELPKGVTIVNTINVTDKSSIACFTAHGTIYSMPVAEIGLSQIVPCPKERTILMIESSLTKFYDFLLTISKKGYVKKTKISEYPLGVQREIVAVKMVEGDELVTVGFAAKDDKLIIASNNGYYNYYNVSDVTATGRATRGSLGIKLKDNEYVVSAEIVHDMDYIGIFSIGSNGKGKVSSLKDYPMTSKNVKGNQVMITDSLAAIKMIPSDLDKINLIANNKIITIWIKNLSTSGRTTIGSKMIDYEGEIFIA